MHKKIASQRLMIVVVFVVILALISLSYHYYRQQNKAAPLVHSNPIMSVKVTHPQATDLSTPFIFSARTYPIEAAQLYARANGYVETRLVDIGDHVTAGQLLAHLSSPELEQHIKEAQAQIQLQEATVLLTKSEFDRASTLVGKGAVSQSMYDERNAAYKVAMATLDLNKAQLSRLQTEYSYTDITAPFDGIISERNIERGDRITSSDTKPLFRLIRTNQLRIVVDVPQTQLFSIKDQGVATLSFAELPEQVFQAPFSRAAQEVSSASGTMRVEFILDNSKAKLPAGLSGEVSIQISTNNRLLLIPANALIVRNSKPSVVLVDKNNKIKFQNVITGRLRSNQVEILAGLKLEDYIVMNPNALLTPGQTVKVLIEDKS